MSRLPVPSASLLRTLLRPSSSVCTACQTRSTSTFMPRSKYAKVNRLDKLHRQQKDAIRHEKVDSQIRAAELANAVEASGQAGTAHNLPFHIGRTKTNNLAIYEHVKAGGSKHITQIRKLSGDLSELQKALRTALQLPDFVVDGKGRKKEPVAINPLTQHIVIKGWRGPEVKTWAESLGF